MPPTVRDRLQSDLRTAMKARDRLRVSVLRATLGAIANAEAVPSDARPNIDGRDERTEMPRRELTEADVVAIVEREVAELHTDAAVHRNRGDVAPLADLEARIAVLDGYLE
jgi:uncharacterized protein YqeY